jgi:hypothetical protein
MFSARLNFLLFIIESDFFRSTSKVINRICRRLSVAHFSVVFDIFDAANATTSFTSMPMSVAYLFVKQMVTKLIWSDGSTYLAKIKQSVSNSSLVLSF